MQKYAKQHTGSGDLDLHKTQWLAGLGLAGDKSVIDCDPSECLVTFLVDGKKVTRRRAECWTRIMGYYRPKDYANIGKQGEFAERVYFTESAAESSEFGQEGKND